MSSESLHLESSLWIDVSIPVEHCEQLDLIVVSSFWREVMLEETL